ncbi:MAG: phosphoribosylaminoimidazolesuccinocarboxamide synthase [Proteobacteria bacterium]|nr:phosphoribosylaminoimidazolesuccinocarboxamide synthase [Pseudomonadota bacterium]NOG60468.1 phosphoribosylaminoimidazolesuccinocarboxamide synthase [Pseudomonadota bacterium]
MQSKSDTLYRSNIKSLPLISNGKVRDIYSIDDQHMLIVTSDRLSAFDVILPDPIPGKGRVLTEVSNFWFNRCQNIIPNHLTTIPVKDVIKETEELDALQGRANVVRKLKPLPIEAVIRGYLIGSGWKDYQVTGSVCGIKLPAGLQQAEKLPEPIFTPATKADVGDHDENINFEDTVKLIGQDLAEQVRDISLKIYTQAVEYALTKDIIIADTKFEFGLDENDQLVLIDEVLTPDSSRFWPVNSYKVGSSPPSFDKQYIRDYLETLDWDKTAPGPKLPEEVISNTAAKYEEARDKLIL